MKKLLFIIVLLASGSLVNFFTNSNPVPNASIVASTQVSMPVQIFIPKLTISAPIEHVGKDASGRMDVPKEWMNTAWYYLGPKPGEIGQAVIAGHLDSDTGPAIFANLNQLQPGDSIRIIDDTAKERTFIVETIETFADENFPLMRVFGPSDEARLNLITCAGIFTKASNQYSHRIVVFTRLSNE